MTEEKTINQCRNCGKVLRGTRYRYCSAKACRNARERDCREAQQRRNGVSKLPTARSLHMLFKDKETGPTMREVINQSYRKVPREEFEKMKAYLAENTERFNDIVYQGNTR